MRNSFWIFTLALAALFFAAVADGHSMRRAIIVSWDGAPDWVVDRLIEEGKLPNVARLAEEGMAADYLVPNYPSVTACGHAAIWTGAFGGVNGVTGNAVPLLPRAEHTILEQRSGFHSASLRAEPIYLTAALAGRKVVVLSATHTYPVEPYLDAFVKAGVDRSRFITFSGFESSIARGKMFSAEELQGAEETTTSTLSSSARRIITRAGDAEFSISVYDDADDPVQGFDTVAIEALTGGERVVLKPSEARNDTSQMSKPILVSKQGELGLLYFRLFDLAPDGSRFMLYQRAVNAFRGTASPEETEQYLFAAGGFHDAPFWSYADGVFGKPLWENGDGAAEERLMELVRFDLELLERGTRYALRTWVPDLLFHYTLASDSAGHTWMGMLDPESGAYDEELAAKVWPYYEKVLMLQDKWLGEIIDFAAGDEHTVVCLVSDHGMAGVENRFFPNAILEQAGLLVRDDKGKIDLSRTQACVPPWSELTVAVNATDWKGGIVPLAEKRGIVDAATEALLSAVDPQTGRHLVTKVFDTEEMAALGIAGPASGDLYFDPATGYYVRDGVSDVSVKRFDNAAQGQGMHGVYSHGRKMQAIWYMAGPGVGRGVRLHDARQIDVAPTLAHLLGIPAPAQAQGHAIGQAIEE